MNIQLSDDKQIEITLVDNISGRFKGSSGYTITGRTDLKLFQIEIQSFDDCYSEWYVSDDYIEFWADSYENCFEFLKITVDNFLSCFNDNSYIDDSRGGFWDIDNIEKYLGYYIKDCNYIEILNTDTQKDIILKGNDVTNRFHYSLRKTSELVHKLKDYGVLKYIKQF